MVSEIFKKFLKDKNVASIAASSKYTVERVCSLIDFKKHHIFIEYGPGTGAFTEYILKNMSKKSKLIVIETNKDFCSTLEKIVDPRLKIFNAGAENVINILKKLNYNHADYVISGIPFSLIEKDLKMKIIKNTFEILPKGGKFLLYQISKNVKKYLENYFENIESHYVIRNIPPQFIFEAIK